LARGSNVQADCRKRRKAEQCILGLGEYGQMATPQMLKLLDESVGSKVQRITKPRNRAVCMGSIAPTLAEAMTSGLKANLSVRNMRVLEPQQFVIQRERIMTVNSEYRERKHEWHSDKVIRRHRAE
jgi:hypothetical protein